MAFSPWKKHDLNEANVCVRCGLAVPRGSESTLQPGKAYTHGIPMIYLTTIPTSNIVPCEKKEEV